MRFVKWFCALALCASTALYAQTTGGLRGQILDPSGAGIPTASVTLTGPNNLVKVIQSDDTGTYTFVGLPPGQYTIRATASGFNLQEKLNVQVAGNRVATLDMNLIVATEKQEVTVADQQNVELDPASNASALVLKEQDLEMFSDDPDDLQSELLALAGPAAGPNGGQIFIDGFSDGRLPPKSQIREIRINSNPFSSEFDRVGFGRIEILTRPGTDRFRGGANINFGDNFLNTRNPYSLTKPPFQEKQEEADLSGPLTKKSSFNLDFEHRGQDESSLIRGIQLDPNFQPLAFNQNVATPNSRTSAGTRLDYALTKNITLTGRYNFVHNTAQNNGVTGFNLPTRGTTADNNQQTVNFTETAILGTKAINESRFQYFRQRNSSSGSSLTPTVQVLDSFTGGGASFSLNYTNNDNYEFQNFTSITHGTHFTKIGIRVRGSMQDSYTTGNYNGTFTFTSLAAYAITQQGLAQGLSLTQIRALGGGPSQYTVAGGTPLANVSQVDAAPFVQDDWKVKPSITLSLGLRYEIQNNISDHHDFAPRIGLAWGIGKGQGALRTPKTVLRMGAGIFYDRVGQNLTLDAIRQNGIVQQTFNIQSPGFYPVAPPVSQLAANQVPQNIRLVYPGIDSPYLRQISIGVDRQLPKNISVSVNYTNSRGVHQLRSRNINAPLPGTGLYPQGNAGPVYMYESSGIFKQSQLSFNINARVNNNFNLFGFYVYGQAHSNGDGAGSFPANTYDLSTEWGRAQFDVRHRFQMGGNVSLKYGLRLAPTIQYASAAPFNITLGKDVNGDSLFTDRPAFASSASLPQNVRITPYGAFDVVPMPGETIIPRNYGSAFGNFTAGFRLSRTWGFGERAGAPAPQGGGGNGGGPPGGFGGGRGGPPPGGFGGGRGGGRGGPPGGGRQAGSAGTKYTLTASLNVRNALNTVNPGAPNGNLSSTLFGQSLNLGGGGFGGNAIANRRMDFSLRFNF